MAFLEMKLFSESLGKCTQVSVIMPQRSSQGQIGLNAAAGTGLHKCLYLLHGLSDDNTIWMRRTSIERYAAKYGIAVVMPDAAKSFYTNMVQGDRYYDYIAHELPAVIEDMFPVSPRREDNFVAGLSMGGYGALKIALRENDKFCAGAGLSAVADIKGWMSRASALSRQVFGDAVADSDDLFRLAETVSPRPRLYMGVGTEDGLYAGNAALRDHLLSLGYDLTWRDSAGNHNWDFWDEYIQHVLAWMFEK